MRRVQTSHNEFSPPVQRKVVSPPLQPPSPPKPFLSRTPTGFNSQDEVDTPVDNHEPVPTMAFTRPSIDTNIRDFKPHPRFDSAKDGIPSASPRDQLSPAVQRERDRHMQASEGMVLRRASTLYMNKNDEKPRTQDVGTGFHPSAQFYNALSEPLAGNNIPDDFSQLSSMWAPGSAVSPDEPSPFADPKYIKRRSGEAPSAPNQPEAPQPSRQARPDYQPSYMRATHSAQLSQPSIGVSRPSVEQPSYMRAIQLPEVDTCRQPPSVPAHNVRVQADSSQSMRMPTRDRVPDAQPVSENSKDFYSQSNQSTSPTNNMTPSSNTGHARNRSRAEISPPVREQAPTGAKTGSPSQGFAARGDSPQTQNARSSLLNPSAPGQTLPSPYSRGPSPVDYFSAPKAPPNQAARTPAVALRQEEASRPGSSGSARATNRPIPSPGPFFHNDPAADLALADFAGRVAHMKGVFKLTAEKERQAERCTPQAWLRAALWWYLRGKAGLETLLQRRSPGGAEARRELLTQPHVDLAKTWWIISDPLEQYDVPYAASPQSALATDMSERALQQSVALLRGHLKSLSASMHKNQLMPPHQSLIQGQDTTIWLQYPRFTSDAAAVLSGNASSKSLLVESSAPTAAPLEALPLGDTRDTFCYAHFPVEVSVNTDEAETDRVVLPCMLSVLRSKRDYQTGIAISSQTELVSIRVGPKQGDAKGLTWHDVSWKASSQSMAIHLPRGFDLTIRMQERDFRSLWSLTEYARKLEHSLRPEAGESLVHEARVTELQYADPSGAQAFPQEKLRACIALVFERIVEHRDGNGVRKMHRGFRLLLVTESSHKSLSSVSHEVCRNAPLLFEFITDATANGTTAMVIRVREESKQCRILLVFPDMANRQSLYDVLNALTVGPDETIVAKTNVTGINIQAATQTEGFTPISHPALQALQWQKLGITNTRSNDLDTREPPTVESDNLRIIARHAAGCITDRLNLGKGELVLRLPCADTPTPTIQTLRSPQEDLTMSIDTRQSPQHVTEGITELLQLAQQRSTIRTFTFATPADLHAFQAAITGFIVRYDGVASTFGISHRMMVVPIYHKKQASKVRLQLVTQGSITKVLAFMEDFSQADALCFQLKSTDTFETVKGDSKGKKWAVKMVDAKFSLPKQEKGEIDPEERVRRRFVNLEGLDYAEEHDDITVGFDTEEGKSGSSLTTP